MILWNSHIISEEEAREYIFNHLEKLIRLYLDKSITYADLYYRIISESLLSEDEKQVLIASPTIDTLYKVFGKESTTLSIDNIEVPLNSVFVVESMKMLNQYVSQYPMLKPVVKTVVPLGIMTIYKAISSLVNERIPRNYNIVILGLPWKQRDDYLSTLLTLARLQGINVISNPRIILSTEKKMIEETIGRSIEGNTITIPTIDYYELYSSVVKPVAEYLKRNRSKINYYLENYPEIELEKIVRALNSIDTSDWWRYNLIDIEFNQKLYNLAIEKYNIPRYIARKIASWKIRDGIEAYRSVYGLLQNIKPYIDDETIMRKVIELLSSEYNLRPEILMNLVNAKKIMVAYEEKVGISVEKEIKGVIMIDDVEYNIDITKERRVSTMKN